MTGEVKSEPKRVLDLDRSLVEARNELALEFAMLPASIQDHGEVVAGSHEPTEPEVLELRNPVPFEVLTRLGAEVEGSGEDTPVLNAAREVGDVLRVPSPRTEESECARNPRYFE